MLTTKEVALEMGVAYTTVMQWLRRGHLKAVEKQEARGKIYLIPRSELRKFERPTTGRPPKGKKQRRAA